jgi:hypothetical protein
VAPGFTLERCPDLRPQLGASPKTWQEGGQGAHDQSAESGDQPVIAMQRTEMQNAREDRNLHEKERRANGGHDGNDRAA